MVFVVEHIKKIAIEGMYILNFGEVVKNVN